MNNDYEIDAPPHTYAYLFVVPRLDKPITPTIQISLLISRLPAPRNRLEPRDFQRSPRSL